MDDVKESFDKIKTLTEKLDYTSSDEMCRFLDNLLDGSAISIVRPFIFDKIKSSDSSENALYQDIFSIASIGSEHSEKTTNTEENHQLLTRHFVKYFAYLNKNGSFDRHFIIDRIEIKSVDQLIDGVKLNVEFDFGSVAEALEFISYFDQLNMPNNLHELVDVLGDSILQVL